MNIGKNSIVILIVFLVTTLSCTQQRTKPGKIAKRPDKVKVAAVQLGGYDKWLKIKEGCNPVESVVKYVERAAAENNIYVIVGCWEVFEDESFSSTALTKPHPIW